MNFAEWCDEVDRLCRQQLAELPEHYTRETGRQDWRPFYDAGETPQEAVDGEIDARRDSL
jgi:hypothetical protein